jgi:hypothetical protein
MAFKLMESAQARLAVVKHRTWSLLFEVEPRSRRASCSGRASVEGRQGGQRKEGFSNCLLGPTWVASLILSAPCWIASVRSDWDVPEPLLRDAGEGLRVCGRDAG